MTFSLFVLHLLRPLYANDLAIWASSPSVVCATSIVQAAPNRLVEWSSKWRLPLNPLKCETFFFSLYPYQSRTQPSLYILNTPLKFNPHPTFLGVTFDRTLSQISCPILMKKVSQPIPCFPLYRLCLLGSIKRILMYPI